MSIKYKSRFEATLAHIHENLEKDTLESRTPKKILFVSKIIICNCICGSSKVGL